MKFKHIVFAILCAAPILASAQDEVALNNGTLLKGKVVRNDKDSVIIETQSGQSYGYRALEVRKVVLGGQLATPEDPNRRPYVDFSTQEKGWWCAAELNNAALFTPEVIFAERIAALSEIAFVNGYRFNEFIKIGVGVGVRCMYPTEMHTAEVAVPLYFDARGNIISQYSRNFSPYWQVDLGYTFDATTSATNSTLNDLSGFYFSPTIGMKFGGWRHNFLVGITYMGQMVKLSDGKSGLTNAIGLRLSYEF